MRRRLPYLLMIPVLIGSFAFHAYRAEHPTSSYQSTDERSYGKLAIDIAERGVYGERGANPFHWPPGAPVAFALGHKLFGDAESARTFDIPAAYWEQVMFSTGTAAAAWALACLLAGAWAGLIAGALVGFYPPLILATGEQTSEPLGALFVILAFLALAEGCRRRPQTAQPSSSGRRRWAPRWFLRGRRVWLYAIGGALLGLAVLTRADLLLAAFLVAALVAFVLWRRREGLGRAIVAGGLIAGGAVVVLAPWTIHASSRAGELVPVTQGSPSALFVGTYLPGGGNTVGMKRKLAPVVYRRRPELRSTPPFELPAQDVLREAVASRHPDLSYTDAVGAEARKNLVRYGLKDPLDFGVMMLDKVQRMWTRYARGGARHTSPWIRGWHILLVLAAMSGLVAGIWRRRSLLLGTILTAILYSTAIHTLVVSQARYNLPLMPALLAGGVAGWFLWARGRGTPAGEARTEGSAPAPHASMSVS